MPVTFTEDERFLIEQLAKTPKELEQLDQKDLDRAAGLLVKHMGDMKFNKKIRSDYPGLAKFIYKTQAYEAIESINRKIQINKKLAEQGLEIFEEEKLSLKEIGQVLRFAEFGPNENNPDFNRKLEYIFENCKNESFKKIYLNIVTSNILAHDIKSNIIASDAYQNNDISVKSKNKDNRLQNNNSSLFTQNNLADQLLLSGYGHAALLYIQDDLTSHSVKKSHLLLQQDNSLIKGLDILGSDIFRIDPAKLVNKNYVNKLTEIYGTDWPSYIRNTYEKLSYSLHHNFELREKEIKELNIRTNKILRKKNKLQQQLDELKIVSGEITHNTANWSNLMKQKTEIEEKIIVLTLQSKMNILEREKLVSTTIKIDHNRLNNPLKWFSPKAIIDGHTKLGHKNDFRALSKEMFNPTEENKKMICSEFGAVTIAASIDQLNRIVARDLQAAELIDKEQEIFKNPIPKNERIDKIHPGRLVHLLKKAGAVEVRNETVDQYVKRNDLTSMKTANIELDLPNKILFLLKNAKTKDDFIDKANKNLAIYLEAYKFDKEVINQIQENAQKQFAEFHDRKNETGILTSIKKLCKGIAVSLHLREKEKSTKKLSGEILTQVEKIQKQRDSKKPSNEKIDSSQRVWTKAEPTLNQGRKFNKNSNTSRSL